MTREEEKEKPKYPKDLDVGRIVIEETPEDMQEIPKGDIVRQKARPRSTETTVTQRKVKEYPKSYSSEDIVKVGKLDVTHLEEDVIDKTKVERSIRRFEDNVDGTCKVLKSCISK